MVIHEPLSDFLEIHREPDELSYLELRQRMHDLSRKGIDASSYLVDLNMKLAVPFTALVLTCVAIPLAGRVQRHPSLAESWVPDWPSASATGWSSRSAMPSARAAFYPVVSAWAANGIFLLLGGGLFLSVE